MKQIHLILLMFFLFLGGCAQSPKGPIQGQTTLNTLNQFNLWQARGKIAFISDDDRQSVNFNWQLKNDKQALTLTSFIGTQVLKMTEFAHHSEIIVDGKPYTGPESGPLIERLSGWQLPIKQAPNWFTATRLGSNYQLDPQGNIKTASWQDEHGKIWAIQYQRYRNFNGLTLPARLTLSHQDISIKIQINAWQFDKQ
ncbi:lipoprotein insertase outer membrane protein LolB [Pseudoalteromonas luteoviolacea]|uniref:Outer-membrane lipoprotein LolB n=1 Tax=Pseudoalteromonas luteoviolacea DSM 6061 TaxID=1365250 RepID=A0A166VDZ7_9GAMM|nr:lipoprotein insertase outer membrane protein LolB [Pseudoalteromonas luteoviolacea]KZN32555.1 hypothetical protein N475_21755 [Pseudoalteromonas luteoviolacea DSM 6061]MBE0387206.1 outer membrane lipoprotein LolB [Pseudoalteromonas luteoviolacea DSM 6061]TQF72042.1 outer membrane lipoprotein LolB [Pseudoalteromonas luteoviolacea]